MKRFKYGSDVGMVKGASDSAGKCILNLLKAFNLCEKKSVIKESCNSQDASGRGKWR